MKKVGIITLQGNVNYGNRLQNYALTRVIREMGFDCYNVVDNNLMSFLKNTIKRIKNGKQCEVDKKRYQSFMRFSENMNEEKCLYYLKKCMMPKNIENNFYKFIVGSDQVWNFNNKVVSKYMLDFTSSEKKISYAASFGKSNIDQTLHSQLKKNLNDFRYLSVREDRGKEIIEELTERNDVEVLIDPTMLLTADEWDEVSVRPSQLDSITEKKYILNYFLGDLSNSRKEEINKIAKENKCHVINILDRNDPFYECGPSEFLYLEKNAFLICTDSFHSSVFAIIYNKPFVVFDREQKGLENMNSRIDTLINKFGLQNRKFNKKITKENIKHDYSDAYKILKAEKKKAKNFLERALDIKEENYYE